MSRILLKTNDLVTHFADLAEKNMLPTIHELRAAAKGLNHKYGSTQAYNLALKGIQRELPSPSFSNHVPERVVPPAPVPEAERAVAQVGVLLGTSNPVDPSEKEFSGDWGLANSILIVRDGIWFIEYCQAVASGDIGRVWEIMKVSVNTRVSNRQTLTNGSRSGYSPSLVRGTPVTPIIF